MTGKAQGFIPAGLNSVVQPFGDPVICLYDLAKLSGDIVIDAMRTRPMIIIGGILQENPFFVPPDEFPQELRERKAKRDIADT